MIARIGLLLPLIVAYTSSIAAAFTSDSTIDNDNMFANKSTTAGDVKGVLQSRFALIPRQQERQRSRNVTVALAAVPLLKGDDDNDGAVPWERKNIWNEEKRKTMTTITTTADESAGDETERRRQRNSPGAARRHRHHRRHHRRQHRDSDPDAATTANTAIAPLDFLHSNPWLFRCPPSATHATLFIPKHTPEEMHEDYAEIGRRPFSIDSCASCSTGSQFSYKAVNPMNDIAEFSNVRNLAIGMFTCSLASNTVVELIDGRIFVGYGHLPLALIPVPICKDGICAVLLALSSVEISDSVGLRHFHGTTTYTVAEQFDGHANRRTSTDYAYPKIRGFSCSGGSRPIPYCDPAHVLLRAFRHARQMRNNANITELQNSLFDTTRRQRSLH